MKICITDSGLGGLSVCDEMVRQLSETHKKADIYYVNASYSHELGYNYLKNRAEQIKMFDRVLHGIEQYCSPDLILVACNTLSILIEHTAFAKKQITPIEGIIDAGVSLITQQVPDDGHISIFGTRLTISSGVYKNRLLALGRDLKNITDIECHGLPMAISCNDDVTAKIARFCQLSPPDAYFLLACTHFGVKSAAFNSSRILNPNVTMATQICDQLNNKGDITLQMVCRYALDNVELASWRGFVRQSSVQKMLEDYQIDKTLFYWP